MAPPKKDAFSDLFNYAHGGSSRSSPSASLHDLSSNSAKQSQSKPTTLNANANAWGDLDILSPNKVHSSAASKPSASVNNVFGKNGNSGSTDFLDFGENTGANDPFAVFQASNGSNSSNSDNKGKSSDPFDFFTATTNAEVEVNSKSARNAVNNGSISNNRSRVEHALLDDDFTDAFTSETETSTEKKTETPSEPVEVSKNHRDESERDHVLAALMAEGFPIDTANQAISQVGPNIEKCVRYIVMSSVDSGRSSPNRHQTTRRESSPKDLGEAFQDISQDFYKKATWFLDKSRKTVIKNINNLQNQRMRRDGNDMPAWISNQHKYKDQAVERRNDGSSYEDYGTDEDNIDTEEIRRIVQLQREKEVERQRQRLETIGRSSSSKSNISTGEDYRQNLADTRRSESPKIRHSENRPVQKAPTSLGSSRSTTPITKKVANAKELQKSASESAPEEDLLGLGSAGVPALSRAQQFKQKNQEESSYMSPSRRRQTQPKVAAKRPASSEPLNTFAQSDYDTNKASGGQAFSAGDYDNALVSYTKCLQSIPEKHELRIVITANLALTAIKIGNYTLALQNCDEGLALVGDNYTDSGWSINEKNIKYWYVRLLTRKAESLEMLENFEASLSCYMTLITKFSVNDKKTMDAKRRVNNIVNPPKPAQKSTPKSTTTRVNLSSSSSSSKNLKQIKNRHMEEKIQEQKKFELHDTVHETIQSWSHGKEDNLRSLLMSLSDILPQHLGFSFISEKKITINDLMLTKKVKINYMKVISSIHPDKLGGLELKDQMICQGVFVALNKAWDEFKKQNNIA